tara:strand:+ start:629 stop:784 length:156 start_codon:yes stop_codon:yes gene_type:complete
LELEQSKKLRMVVFDPAVVAFEFQDRLVTTNGAGFGVVAWQALAISDFAVN